MKSLHSHSIKSCFLVFVIVPGLAFSQAGRRQVKKVPVNAVNTINNVPATGPTQEPTQQSQRSQPPDQANNFFDNDQDGIDDNMETRLLERFRPYFKFSFNKNTQDEYRPTDVLFYLEHSELNKSHVQSADNTIISNNELAAMPYLVLLLPYRANQPTARPNGSPVITEYAGSTEYYINPLEHVNGENGDEPGRHGNSWAEVLKKRNVGLYGHVVPIKLNRPQDYDRKRVLTGSDAGNQYYKIEYWQFFGYNEDGLGGAANHEGDWTTVQLLYNPVTDKIEGVFHYAHGKIEFRFFVDEANSVQEFASPPGKAPVELYKEYRGRNYGKYGDIVSLIDNYSHNTLRLLQDPVTKEFSHPFVYIEWGAHEFWPTESGFYPGVPTHNGEGYSFLTATPPNLGEVENLLPQSGVTHSFDEIILHFNGYWGTQGGPPPGPPMHYQWTWPASSSIRWQLKNITD